MAASTLAKLRESDGDVESDHQPASEAYDDEPNRGLEAANSQSEDDGVDEPAESDDEEQFESTSGSDVVHERPGQTTSASLRRRTAIRSTAQIKQERKTPTGMGSADALSTLLKRVRWRQKQCNVGIAIPADSLALQCIITQNRLHTRHMHVLLDFMQQ